MKHSVGHEVVGQTVGPVAPPPPSWGALLGRSLLLKQSLFVAVVVASTAGILSLASYLISRRILTEEIQNHLETVATSRSERVKAYRNQQLERIRLVASRTRLRLLLGKPRVGVELAAEDRDQIEQIMEDARQNSSGFEAIWVTDPEGRVLASTDPAYLEQTYSEEEDFQRGRQAAYLGRPRQSGDRYVARLVGPAKLDEKTVGVVMVQLDASELQSLLRNQFGLGDSGTVLIGRFDGTHVRLLLPPPGFGSGEMSTVDSPELARAVSGVSGRGQFRLLGKSVLEAHEPVEYSPGHESWGLVALVDRREAYLPVARLGWLLVFLEFVLVVIGGLASYLLARRFTRPILRMAAAAAGMSTGNLGAQVVVTSRDEIGVLADALNGMSTRLAVAQDDLEQRVHRRTRQLALANRELELARKAAEDANVAKSVFLASMSHEIRNPLNALLGMTELVLETPLTIAQREYLETVHESGQTLLTVINDVLDFSKIEAGKLDLELSAFDVHECVADTAKLLAERAHTKGLELACDIRPDTPRFLTGDPGRLRQILINLIGNAIKFTERGEVIVQARPESMTLDEVRLEFEVSDTGIGVPPEHQAEIFNAFEQGDNSTARRFGGTGLGLAISSRLVKLMKGVMRLDSQLGIGSRFCFTATFERVGEEGPNASGPSPARAATPRMESLGVLVVDDNSAVRQIFQRQLAAWGIIPELVADTDEATRRLWRNRERGHPFDVLICDAALADSDGYSLVERLRNDPAHQDTPVIMLTQGHNPLDVERCQALKVVARLHKPVNFLDLGKYLWAIHSGDSSGLRETTTVAADRELLVSVRPLRILLAEDSIVNQRLAVILLERAGHQVTVAGDGKEAVRQATRHPFDVILMDVQMPGMDGFEATRLIREFERDSGGRVPIIAITAHALKGYREKCLEAGMDEYISKPIRASRLFAAIRSVLDCDSGDAESAPAAVDPDAANLEAGELEDGDPEAGGPEASPTATDPARTAATSAASATDTATLAPSEIRAALKTLGGRESLCRELARVAIEETPRLLGELDRAVACGDAEAAGRAAHTLTGSIRYFQADKSEQPSVEDLTGELESVVRDGRFERAAVLAEQLRPAMERVLRVLVDYTSSDDGGSR